MRPRSRWAVCAATGSLLATGTFAHAGATGAVASVTSWTAYVANQSSSSVTPIDTATNTAGAPISAGAGSGAVAITPDGKTAYVVNFGAKSVTPIATATHTPGNPITVGTSPSGIAITSDGKTAYVTSQASNTLTPINTATNAVGTPIPVPGHPFGIVITPDGMTAYVGTLQDNSVTPIDLTNRTVGTAIPVGNPPYNIAITPDGATIYVAIPRSNSVTPIATATNIAGTPIPTGAAPIDVAITPDGTTAFVTDQQGETVIPINTATDVPGTAISIPGDPTGIAITPDGKTAYVSSLNSGTVTPFDVATGSVGSPITVGAMPGGLAIAPDQAPIARLSVVAAPLGAASIFDASASTVTYGTIASYAWTFGDGHLSTTTTPTTTHTYAAAGTYTAAVTETSSGGTSTSEVFTGRTMSRSGGPSAQTSQVATVVAPGAYTPLTPFRVCDTRANVPANQCRGHPLGPAGTLAVHITGQTGPFGQAVAANALAVAVNATALGQAGVGSFLSVFPTGEPVPRISNINFQGAAPQANLVVVRLGAAGEISVHNSVGTAGVVIDVEGYFAPPGSAPIAGEFHSMQPLRMCDTRAGKNTECDGPTTGEPLAGLTWRRIVLSGLPPGAAPGTQPIPGDGTAAAAVFNLTATQGTQATYLAVAPPDPTTDACPTHALSSNLNPATGETLPNRVISSLGPHQDVCVFNAAGSVDFIIDVNGWFGNGNETMSGALFYSVAPVRICDTRAGAGTSCASDELAPTDTEVVDVAGVLVVPAEGGSTNPVAVVANVTGVIGSAATYFTLYPSDAAKPVTSDLNPGAGEVIANLAFVGLATTGPDAGDVNLFNAAGDINAILDVAGWFQ